MPSDYIANTASPMIKTITINSIPVKFRADGATPRMYRVMYGRDIFADMDVIFNAFKGGKENKKQDDSKEGGGEGYESFFASGGLSVLEDVAYCMAKQATPEIPEITEWLGQFRMMDIYQHMMEIIELWGINSRTTSTAKKKRRRQRGK